MAYITIVDSYLNLSNVEDAIATLKELNEDFPDTITGKAQLYHLLMEQQREAEGSLLREELLKIKPVSSTELEILVRVLFELAEFDRAEREIQHYLEINPHHNCLKILLTIPYIKKGKEEIAQQILEEFKTQKVWYYYGKKEFLEKFLTQTEKERCGFA